MKQYLVNEDWMKWFSFTHRAEQYVITADCPPSLPLELPPGARVFTEEHVKAVFNKHGVNGYRNPIRDAILKDLFGEVKDDHK